MRQAILAFSLAAVSSAAAANLYVAPTGATGAAGTSAAPTMNRQP